MTEALMGAIAMATDYVTAVEWTKKVLRPAVVIVLPYVPEAPPPKRRRVSDESVEAVERQILRECGRFAWGPFSAHLHANSSCVETHSSSRA